MCKAPARLMAVCKELLVQLYKGKLREVSTIILIHELLALLKSGRLEKGTLHPKYYPRPDATSISPSLHLLFIDKGFQTITLNAFRPNRPRSMAPRFSHATESRRTAVFCFSLCLAFKLLRLYWDKLA
jgi:hypothetical protein